MDLVDARLSEALESRLGEIARTSGPALTAVLTPVLQRRGKRMRPRLLLALAGDRAGPAALTCAAGVELLHQSSLIHDDLMDRASLRGGTPAVHAVHGSAMAVVAGDFLVAAGLEALASVDGRHATAGLQAYTDMCRGQALETASRYRLLEVDEHLGVVAGKTGALIRGACTIGARLAGLDPARVAKAGRFGLALGVLYQLVDDLLDLCGTPAQAGKPVGQDLANGVYTLPALLAARLHGRAFTEQLGRGAAGLAAARDMAAHGDILAEATRYARRYATTAERSAGALPPGPVRDWLAKLPDRLLDRAMAGPVAAQAAR
ncbi:polyprenyl synthetase family protein [Micromonospora sp. NPDC005254]|uniref:polyprenyl synthetase family protein n=1 Tax=Micromonospora sp. NPDC005254 TaxID=3364229 RepID=UPI00367C7A70